MALSFRAELLCVGVLLCPLVEAQSNFGLASGNYAGIAGAWLNPASIVDSRYKFDMAIFGYESYFTNNYVQMNNRVLFSRLFSKEPYNSSFEAGRELVTPLNEVDGKVHGATVSDWQFPFSFMTNVGPRSAIALNLRNRSDISVDGLDQGTARMLYSNLKDPDLMGIPQDNSGFRFNYMNWMEVGLTYGRVLVKSDHHFLKGAFTGKLLAGNSAIFMASDDLQLTFEDTGVISVQSPLIGYGRTERADFDTYQRRNLLNGVEDFAFGWDVGLVYELRGSVSKGRYMDLDNVEKERLDLNKYIVRVGVSVLDGGKFTYDRRPLSQDHSANITGWDIAQVNASDLDQFDTAYSEVVDYVPNSPSTFTFRLPTAIAANIDLHAFGGFYLNVGTYQDATAWFKDATTTLHAREWVAFTPRFESRGFGLYVPVSRSDEQIRIGLTLRVGPFYFGSNNLADMVSNAQNTQADFHFGMRFCVAQGKPTLLRRKYEAMRMQQDGISSNHARIDSLEREVRVLRTILSDTTLGRSAIVNNYYIAGPDSTTQRLQMENYLLVQQLADARVAQHNDSLERDRSRDGDKRADQQAKAMKDQASAQADQASAQEDQAKEMEKIRKQMKLQTAMMATTAGATVALAAKGGKEKGKKEAAVYVNDSTIVLDGDTIPLVIPAAADSARAMRMPGDTVRITVNDTVWIVADTVIAERTLHDTVIVPAAPVLDVAVPRELVAPVYFATGSTEPGPETVDRLRELANWLNAHPDRSVTLTGVADASGAASVNRTVAAKRAASVREVLLDHGVPAARITSDSRIAPVQGKANARDRRTEIEVTP